MRIFENIVFGDRVPLPVISSPQQIKEIQVFTMEIP